MIILLIVVLFGPLYFKFLFYSVIAKNMGLETINPLGKNKTLNWEEIIGVRRPRFGIPYEFTYVVSKTDKKILLLRSMPKYKELISLIKTHASNLNEVSY